jgi:galactose mutarotase-like enzyme
LDTHHVTDELLLRAGPLRAAISPHGAELASLRRDRLDVLWRPDPEVWGGTCPVLFPVIGRVRNDEIRVDGQSYQMPMHGFAAEHPFAMVDRDIASCSLELRDNEAMRQHFPFAFQLRMRFRLDPDGLTVETTIANPGPRPLPASVGLHPGFAWPLVPGTDKLDYTLRFPDDECLVYTRPVDRLLGPSRRILPLEGGELRLTEDLFREGGLLFLAPKSRKLSYGRTGGPSVTLEYPDFPQLLLWMRPGAPFLCIEPCRGHADSIDFAGDYAGRPGAMTIEPGQEETLTLRIVVETDESLGP